MFRYKINVLEELKQKGYNTNRIRKEHIMGESMLQKIRSGQLPSWATMEKLCEILSCGIGDIIEYVPDSESESFFTLKKQSK